MGLRNWRCAGGTMTPNVVHFVYPAWTNTRPLSILNYLAVKLVIKKHKPGDVKFWIDRDPVENEWWEKIKPLVSIHRRKMDGHHKGIEIRFPQYRSDITRLEILKEEGGIYMDTDVLTLRSLDRFMNGPFTMPEEPHGTSLSNAIMISEPDDPFIHAWLDKMPEALQARTWATTGVVIPFELARTNQFKLSIIDYETLCPLDLNYPYMFEPKLNLAAKAMTKDSYAIHIYETYWRDIVSRMDRAWVEETDCLFSKMYKEAVK